MPLKLKLKAKELYSWDPRRDGLTQSMLATVLSCPEKANLSLREGLTSTRQDSAALMFGSVFHLTKDIFSNSVKEDPDILLKSDDALLCIVDEALSLSANKTQSELALAPEQTRVLFEREMGMIEHVFRAYILRWRKEDSRIKWKAIEHIFDVPFTFDKETIRLRGKRDGEFYQNKGLWLHELKTKSDLKTDAIADKLNFDKQVMMYFWTQWLEYGERPVGCCYDLVRRPQLRRGKNQPLKEFLDRIAADVKERPDWYFVRLYARLDAWRHVEEWVARDFTNMLRDTLRWWDGLRNYKDDSQCISMYGTCQFLPICSDSLKKESYERKTTAFSELEIL